MCGEGGIEMTQQQQQNNFLSGSFYDEPIHDANQLNQNQSNLWKAEFHDAELYLLCGLQPPDKPTDCIQVASIAAIVVQLSANGTSIFIRVEKDEDICWQLDKSTRVLKESNFEYLIHIPPDEQLLLALHPNTPQRLIAQLDEQFNRVCQFDNSGAEIQKEWEVLEENYSLPATEDLVAEVIGQSGRTMAKGIEYSSKTLQKNIERVGLFSRHWTWKSGSEEELPPKVVVESVESALWASEYGKEIVQGVADTVTGITTYISNSVGNSLRATGWFTAKKDAPEWRSVKVAKTLGQAWVYSSGQVWDSIGKGVEGVVVTSCKETTLFLKYKYGRRTGELAENVCGTLQNCYDASRSLKRLAFKSVATSALQQAAHDLYSQDVGKK
eukprot:TRINITY_DN45504_c0_g1_i14.p1 TRINITY_DN45504_c0_g1~~TRINITY_DN45504_c0_g1_i14.p1  ORF type:complete len:384 (-),score=47.46 TRINITY_DN45504_c0_g1_i14:532-1683(-)